MRCAANLKFYPDLGFSLGSLANALGMVIVIYTSTPSIFGKLASTYSGIGEEPVQVVLAKMYEFGYRTNNPQRSLES
jgi:hypothetical protein